MSAIAELLINHGYKVSGSDMKDSRILDKLRNYGAEIYIGHDSNNIQNPDLVVYTAAIKGDNCERLKAKQLKWNVHELFVDKLGAIVLEGGK